MSVEPDVRGTGSRRSGAAVPPRDYERTDLAVMSRARDHDDFLIDLPKVARG